MMTPSTVKFPPEETERFYKIILDGAGFHHVKGTEYRACCILHGGDNPSSLWVNLATGAYCCFACGAKGGGIFAFEQERLQRESSAGQAPQYDVVVQSIRELLGLPFTERVYAEDVRYIKSGWDRKQARDWYRYTNELGEELYTVWRFVDALGNKITPPDHPCPCTRDPKAPCEPGCVNSRVWGIKKIRRVLYHLPDVIQSSLCFIVEGEKDTDNLSRVLAWHIKKHGGLRLGELTFDRVAVTTNIGGAEGWKSQFNYGKFFTGKIVIKLGDKNAPGRKHDGDVCRDTCHHSAQLFTCELPVAEDEDISDYLEHHNVDDLIKLLESDRKLYEAPQSGNNSGFVWVTEGMDTFLSATDAEVNWLVPDVLAPECLTQIYAPRGLGKSVLSDFWAVKLVASGKRVLILDRDNPRHTLRSRLRNLGADDLAEQKGNLRIAGRGECPPLTRPEDWATFPYADYDVVIVDSFDSMAEGVGEQDSSKPSRAMAPLLNICRRENGPAILVLGNTVRSGEHSRGSGVVEDRGDIVYEMRDATDFRPSGNKPWIEELPVQGASEWAARSARRKGRSIFRLAMVATKFRDGEEPPPRMLEVSMAEYPWTVTDVTATVDAQGEQERERRIHEKAEHITNGIAILLREIDRRTAAGEAAILKTEAETFLMAEKFTRKEARTILASDRFEQVPRKGKGAGLEVCRRTGKGDFGGKVGGSVNPNKDAGFIDDLFSPQPAMRTAEIRPSKTSMDKGDFETPIFAAGPVLYPRQTSGKPKTPPGQAPSATENSTLSGANGRVNGAGFDPVAPETKEEQPAEKAAKVDWL